MVGSRRHIGGAGDHLEVHPSRGLRLTEIKGTKRPFDHFGPKDRAALVKEAAHICAEPWLAWRRGGKTTWLEESEWP